MGEEREPAAATSDSVGALILERRTALGLSQAQVAEAAGVHRSRIIAAEKGESTPTMGVCLKLAPHLGVSQDEIVRTLVHELVVGADPSVAESIQAELGPASFWLEVARRHGVQIERGLIQATVDPSGR